MSKGKIIVLASGGKGGVGKSVAAINLAGALAHRGNKTALVDTDMGDEAQGNPGVRSVTKFCAARDNLIEQGEDLKPISLYQFLPNQKIQNQLSDIALSHDYVVVDTPGAATTALRSTIPVADVIYLPMNCTLDEFIPLGPIFELARGVEEQMEVLGVNRKIDLRILPYRVDPKWKLDRAEVYGWHKNIFGDIASFSSLTIPYAKAFSETASFGLTLHDKKNKYRASFDLMIDEIHGERSVRIPRNLEENEVA